MFTLKQPLTARRVIRIISGKVALQFFTSGGAPYGTYGNPSLPSYPFTFPPFTLSFSVFYFSLSFLTCFIYFRGFPSLPILPE